MTELKEWLNSINFNKDNLIDEDPDIEKQYPSYIVNLRIFSSVTVLSFGRSDKGNSCRIVLIMSNYLMMSMCMSLFQTSNSFLREPLDLRLSYLLEALFFHHLMRFS